MPHPATLPQPAGKIPKWRWRDGRQYFHVAELARMRKVSRTAAVKWARRRIPTGQALEIDGRLYAQMESANA